MAIEFKDRLDEYKSWSDQNPEGYVLNRRPGNQPPMLHRAHCGHIYPAVPEYGDFTKKPKVCFANRQEFEQWTEQRKVQYVLCSNCDV